MNLSKSYGAARSVMLLVAGLLLVSAAVLSSNLVMAVGDDFSIGFGSSLLASSIVGVPNSSQDLVVTVTSLNGFSSPVSLSFFGVPGVIGGFDTNPVTPPAPGATAISMLTVFLAGNVPGGTHTLTVTGSSGQLSHSASLTLTVLESPSDFSISPSPSVVGVTPGSSASVKIIVSSLSGFNSPVDLAAYWVGGGPGNVSLNLPSPVTPPGGGTAMSTLTVNVGIGASTGLFYLNLIGTNGQLTHSQYVTVQVSPSVIIRTTSANIPSAESTSDYVQELTASPVSADSCSVELSSYVASATPDVSNIEVIVPVRASCSMINGQLHAVGDAYDGMTNAHLSSADTILLPTSGGTTYMGQLVFNFPPQPQAQRHATQVSVSIFSGRLSINATLLATTTETVPVDPNNNYINVAGCAYGQGACNPVYNFCQSPANNSTTQCVGYLYQDSNGCVELVIQVYSPYGLISKQYYTLHDLPSPYPPIGTWITVTGQQNQGYNSASNGAACPGNYIAVTSISP